MGVHCEADEESWRAQLRRNSETHYSDMVPLFAAIS
jgi:hypothetical protein